MGLRKTIGADRGQLITQFIGESFVLTLIAALIGILLIRFVLLGLVNNLFDTQLSMNLGNPVFWILLGAIIVLVSGVVEAFIAYYIIKVQPVIALKGGKKVASGKQPFRHLLVAVQFMITITLLSSAFFIQSQLRMLQKNIGELCCT